MWPICSTCVHSRIHLHYIRNIDFQSVQPFDHISQSFDLLTPWNHPKYRPGVSWGELFLACVHSEMNPQMCTKSGASRSSRLTASQDFLICDPLTPPPPSPDMLPGIEGRLIFSLGPFPDESADLNQSLCQSVKPFDSFPWLLNVWPTKTPQVTPCVSRANLFGVYPFPDESAYVYQIWCQSVQPFDIFHWLLNLWPPKPPPPLSRVELYLAYVHSQTNPQKCTKFGANRSSRLTASQTFGCVTP